MENEINPNRILNRAKKVLDLGRLTTARIVTAGMDTPRYYPQKVERPVPHEADLLQYRLPLFDEEMENEPWEN